MNKKELFYKNAKLVTWYFNKKFKKYAREEEDMLQEGYLGLWKACLFWDGKRNFSTYAVTHIKNQMIMYLRKLSTRIKHFTANTDTANPEGITVFDITQEDLTPFAEEELNIEYYLKNIKPRKAEMFRLFCKGYTRQEVADILGITNQSVSHCFGSVAEQIKDNMSDGWGSRIQCPLYQPGECKATISYVKKISKNVIIKSKLKENNFKNADGHFNFCY